MRTKASSVLPHVVGIVALMGVGIVLIGGSPSRHRWTFLEDAAPDVLGFRVGAATGGEWSIEDDHAATGARSLVNRVGEENAPPATLVSSRVQARDVEAATRCRVREEQEGACGLVFRYHDDGAHHVARVEAGSGQIVLARVTGGTERVLGRTDAPVLAGVWHELVVEARGDAIRVTWNGRRVIDVHDIVPSPIGGVGLWAPSGSEAYFDELAVEVFPSAPQVVEVLPLLRRPS